MRRCNSSSLQFATMPAVLHKHNACIYMNGVCTMKHGHHSILLCFSSKPQVPQPAVQLTWPCTVMQQGGEVPVRSSAAKAGITPLAARVSLDQMPCGRKRHRLHL
jgi:hypothetical protein